MMCYKKRNQNNTVSIKDSPDKNTKYPYSVSSLTRCNITTLVTHKKKLNLKCIVNSTL